MISTFNLLKIFSKKAMPIFLNYSEVEVNRIASLVINNSLINEIGTKVVFDDLFVVKEDKTVPDGYIDRINQSVSNKFTMSNLFIKYNIYEKLVK